MATRLAERVARRKRDYLETRAAAVDQIAGAVARWLEQKDLAGPAVFVDPASGEGPLLFTVIMDDPRMFVAELSGEKLQQSLDKLLGKYGAVWQLSPASTSTYGRWTVEVYPSHPEDW